MFEIIETQQINNLTCYKVRTTYSVDWYYFKGTEIKDIRYFKTLTYHRKSKCKLIIPIVSLNHDDWLDAKKFLKSLNDEMN